MDEAALSLLAASAALDAPTETETTPSTIGVISTVYTVLLTATKFEALPFVSVRSPTTKPVTASLNVIVIGIGDTIVELPAVVVTFTVGRTLS